MNAANRSETILVADDDAVIRGNLTLLLRSEGYVVREAGDGEEASRILADPEVSLALLDLKMPRRGGLEVLREHKDRLEETPVIVITALGGSTPAIEAMKLGAYDFITKPFDLDEVLFTIRRALTQRSLVAQVQAFSSMPTEPDAQREELIGRTPAMLRVFKSIGLVAGASEPVLIVGESGTGKELVANAIHVNSERAERPFVKVNCAALSSGLLESEMFGHERGAFTGAVAQRKGRFETAQGGTLFLDEVGELDLPLQAKLLRVLQTGQFERVGASETIQVNVRVVSATNRDLPALVQAGRFREDLFYRLNVVLIELPPLRDRREDVRELTRAIVQRLAGKYQWPNLAVSPDAQAALNRFSWPGNVRQLQNVLARAAILARGRTITEQDLTLAAPPPSATAPGGAESFSLKTILAETERRVIARALEQEKWNRTRAARLLGISRRQLFDKIQEYQLREPQ